MNQYRPPEFRNYTFIEVVKLLAGVVVFLVMCLAIILLAGTVGRIIDGNTSLSMFLFLFVHLTIIAALLSALFLLSRKDNKTLEISPIARKFAKQKFRFQISVILLIIFTVFALVVFNTVLKNLPYAEYYVAFGFMAGYILLGNKFWRCPNCGYKMSFTNKLRDRQSVQYCANCNQQLQ